MSWIIAISNQKGGVGKTTTCTSLGACLAELGNRTLIVDLDSQSNLTLSAGLDPDHLEYAVPDILVQNTDLPPEMVSRLIHPSSIEGLDILPSDIRLATVEYTIFQQDDYESLLKNQLTRWRDIYSFILIDCPPSLGAMSLIALTAAQLVIVPVQCEYYSARGLMRLVDVINAVKEHTNPDLDYRLVTTMFDKRNRITLRVYDQLQAAFKDKFFDTIINIDTRLRESAVVGEPIIQYSPRSRGSLNYRQLARELVKNINAILVR